MQIEFVAGPVAATASPVARVVDQDGVPATLEAVLIEGAQIMESATVGSSKKR